MAKLDGLDLNNTSSAEVWKTIIMKENPQTSDEVRKLFRAGTFLQKELIKDVIVESSESTKVSILDIGKENPVTPIIGKESFKY